MPQHLQHKLSSKKLCKQICLELVLVGKLISYWYDRHVRRKHKRESYLTLIHKSIRIKINPNTVQRQHKNPPLKLASGAVDAPASTAAMARPAARSAEEDREARRLC